MANPYDEFDAPAGNPFDEFDQPERSWSNVAGSAIVNAPASVGRVIGGAASALMHPIDTATNIGKLVVGAGERGMENLVGQFNPELVQFNRQINAPNEREQMASAVGDFYGKRYGSEAGLKESLATDPAGVLADASTLLTGGGSLASRLPKVAALGGLSVTVPKIGVTGRLPFDIPRPGIVGQSTINIPQPSQIGDMVARAGRAIDPLAASVNAAATAIPMIGRGAANIIGGVGTHTGGESLQQAARAGIEGGDAARTFADNMRGNVPMTEVLDAAKANLAEMGRAKAEAYRQGMAQVSGDKEILKFDGIDNAVKQAAQMTQFKGQIKNTAAAKVQQAIADEIANWKALPADQFHTPEGLDALKQKIGGIVESVPFEEKTARLVGNTVYHSIKNEIVKQAPIYADTMKAYSEATDQIREIERALSLGSKSAVDTAMRKLQSLTRNNVNTNYGNRLSLAKELEQQGGRQIMPALSGQALSSWTPRGLGGAVAGGLGMGGYALGGAGAAIPVLAAQSPRLMGEAALATGRVAGGVQRSAAGVKRLADLLGVDPAVASNLLYQSSQATNIPMSILIKR